MESLVGVGIVGYGRFGCAFGQLLSEAGVPFRAYDPVVDVPEEYRASSLADLTRGAGLITVAVPVNQVRAALAKLRPHLSPSQVVFDVASVKVSPAAALEDVLGADIPWVATQSALRSGQLPLRSDCSMSSSVRHRRASVTTRPALASARSSSPSAARSSNKPRKDTTASWRTPTR